MTNTERIKKSLSALVEILSNITHDEATKSRLSEVQEQINGINTRQPLSYDEMKELLRNTDRLNKRL